MKDDIKLTDSQSLDELLKRINENNRHSIMDTGSNIPTSKELSNMVKRLHRYYLIALTGSLILMGVGAVTIITTIINLFN